MYKSFFYVGLLLPILLLAITGCNDSNDDNVHAESSVTIGLIFPLSAPEGKPRHHAALLAAQHLEDAGFPIRTVVEDSKQDPFLGVEAALKLVENGGAKILIGATSSDVTMEIAQWVSKPKQIPQISYASTSPEITELDDGGFLFRTVPSDKLQGPVLAYLAKEEKGYDKVAVIYRQGSYGESLRLIFEEEFKNRVGIAVTQSLSHKAYLPADFEQTSTIEEYFKPIFDSLLDSDLDAIVAISYRDETDIYVKQALNRQKALIEEGSLEKKVNFIFVDGNKGVSIFDGIDKHELNDMCGTFPSPPNYKLPSEKDSRLIFENSYNDVFPQKGQEQSVIETHTFLHHSYDAVIVAGLAAYAALQEKGQAITSIDIRDQLDKVADSPGTKIYAGANNIKKALTLLKNREPINYEGASGSVDFDKNGDVIAPIEIWCYNNGKTKPKKICEVTEVETTPKVVCKEPTPKPSQQ